MTSGRRWDTLDAVDAPPPPSAAPGPRVVRLSGLVLAVVWVAAWWSLGIQVAPLLGTSGVLPLAEACRQPTAGAGSFACALAPLVEGPFGDGVLFAAVALGLLCATAAATGHAPRPMLAACAGLYGLFLAAAPSFFPSIGDKLLVEATLLIACLPRHRAAPLPVALARGALVKLYWSLGAAQWRAQGRPWQRGPALGAFLQQVPLPTRSGWYVAHLPAALLTGLTRLGLLLELCVPWLTFGPRPVRLAAVLGLTALQLGVANLVNDGPFAFAAIALHLLALGEADVLAAQRDVAKALPFVGPWLEAALAPPTPNASPRARRLARVEDFAASAAIGGWLFLAAGALFGALGAGPAWLQSLAGWHASFTYVHAGAPLNGRVEPVFEVQVDGGWHPVELWHQPGDPWRAPRLVLPHQPRLDAALSAAGKNRGDPAAEALLRAFAVRLCRPPEGLGRLLRRPPGPAVQAVRWTYFSYAFAGWDAHRQTGAWWTRAEVADGETHACAAAPAPAAPLEPVPAGGPPGADPR